MGQEWRNLTSELAWPARALWLVENLPPCVAVDLWRSRPQPLTVRRAQPSSFQHPRKCLERDSSESYIPDIEVRVRSTGARGSRPLIYAVSSDVDSPANARKGMNLPAPSTTGSPLQPPQVSTLHKVGPLSVHHFCISRSRSSIVFVDWKLRV